MLCTYQMRQVHTTCLLISFSLLIVGKIGRDLYRYFTPIYLHKNKLFHDTLHPILQLSSKNTPKVVCYYIVKTFTLSLFYVITNLDRIIL